MNLGDMGAEIIKIEQPGKGDDTRAWGPPFAGPEAAYFLGVNRNKKSVTLNLKDDRGLEILKTLIKDADVLIENFKALKFSIRTSASLIKVFKISSPRSSFRLSVTLFLFRLTPRK